MRQSRLKRYTVPMEEQTEFESANLWRKVSEAIEKDDQHAATEEKSALEEAQRNGAKERKAKGYEWVPKYFELDSDSDSYVYLHSDLRPWDPMNDLQQYEKNFIVCTRTMHKTPMIRTQSIVSVSDAVPIACGSKLRRRRNTKEKLHKNNGGGSGDGPSQAVEVSEEAVAEKQQRTGGSEKTRRNPDTDFSDGVQAVKNSAKQDPNFRKNELSELLRPLEEMQRITTDRLSKLQHSLDVMAHHQRERDANSNINRDMVVLVILVVMIQAVLNWVLTARANAAAAGSGDFGPPPSHLS